MFDPKNKRLRSVSIYDEQDTPVARYFHAELRHALQAAMAAEEETK